MLENHEWTEDDIGQVFDWVSREWDDTHINVDVDFGSDILQDGRISFKETAETQNEPFLQDPTHEEPHANGVNDIGPVILGLSLVGVCLAAYAIKSLRSKAPNNDHDDHFHAIR